MTEVIRESPTEKKYYFNRHFKGWFRKDQRVKITPMPEDGEHLKDVSEIEAIKINYGGRIKQLEEELRKADAAVKEISEEMMVLIEFCETVNDRMAILRGLEFKSYGTFDASKAGPGLLKRIGGPKKSCYEDKETRDKDMLKRFEADG